MSDIQTFIDKLPGSTVNNSRSLVKRKYQKYLATKSVVIGRELEEITGIPFDEKDYGADQNIEKGETEF